VVLEKDGGDQFDRSREKGIVTKSGDGEKYLTKYEE
jgi:hypothetical protein